MFSELTAQVDVLKIDEEVSILHPEDSILHLIVLILRGWLVVQLSLSLGSPLLRVVGPVTVPLLSVIGLPVRVLELEQLCALVFLDLNDGVCMALHNSLLRHLLIPAFVLRCSHTHEHLHCIKSPEFVR